MSDGRSRLMEKMTCPLCDGTGYKDYAGFAMDPCDHEKGPALRPALNRSAASTKNKVAPPNRKDKR